jgi:hypothetical protein
MYGGLFGDLPAAKGSKSGNDDDDKQPSPKDRTASCAAQQSSTTTDQKALGAATMMFLPRKKAKTAASQISQAVGAAGTSMAFVPSAARKKPNRFAKLLQAPKTVVPPKAEANIKGTIEASSGQATNDETAAMNPPLANDAATPSSTPTTTTSFHQSTVMTTIHSTKTTTTAAKNTPQSVIHIHQTTAHPASSHKPTVTSSYKDHHDEEEDEINDPYDPYVPNDLLQYWERQSLAKERATLERETRNALEKQRQLRQQLEREREELHRKGNYENFVQEQQQPGRGRGRGRGVSNLPAWLVEKQRREGV